MSIAFDDNQRMPAINSLEKLEARLKDKPIEWSQILAVRSALRVLPLLDQSRDYGVADFALRPIRAIFVAWSALNYPACDMKKSAEYAAKSVMFSIIGKIYEDNDDCLAAAAQSAYAIAKFDVGFVINGITSASNLGVSWESISDDFQRLEAEGGRRYAARRLSNHKLWDLTFPYETWTNITGFYESLLATDPSYVVWRDWYERRIRGESSAFDIPGDHYRREDKAILRRLAEATDEDFWGKGYKHVNAELSRWLDEARARAAPQQINGEAHGAISLSGSATGEVGPMPLPPPQEAGAIAYGVNGDGKLDRLPHSDQVHLRDVADQRRAYQDLRDAAAALLDEGQRLGHRLKRALERFLQSLPERFQDAEAYLVWRDANALRRLHLAHREAVKSPEPDEAKLEPVVAEGLGGVLDLYNNFAFADDGLRAKDEARISPQERASAEVEALASAAVVLALQSTPKIATERVADDIRAEVDADTLPKDEAYFGQALDQSNRIRRNWVAGLLDGASKVLGKPELVGRLLTRGALVAFGTMITTGLWANHIPILDFLGTNALILSNYVVVAFPAFPHLPDLIEKVRQLWAQV